MKEKTILIIDDELIIAKDLQCRLEIEGYNIPEIFSNGSEALKEIERIKPDMIITDIQLESRFDGVETAEQIRLNYNIPVIYITAHVNKDTMERVKVTQPTALLLKPINYTELLSAIELGIYKAQMDNQKIKLLNDLQLIVTQSNVLKDMKVPVCSKCNSIREDNSNWINIEEYLKKYFNIEMIESVCPDCLEELYPIAYSLLQNRIKLKHTS